MMRLEKEKLPIGIEMFRKIRTAGFYYVDKTGLIEKRHICGQLKSTPL